MVGVVLRLYVSGHTTRSEQALANARRLLSQPGAAAVDLEVIDILQHPELAEEENLLATPTLIKVAPPPIRRVIGDLSDMQAVSDALGLSQDAPLGQEGQA